MTGPMSAEGRNRSVSDAELIEAVKRHPDPAVKSSEVATEVGLTSTRINELLGQLEHQGFLESKRFGSGKGWWVVNQPQDA